MTYWALHFEVQEHRQERYEPRVRIYGPIPDPALVHRECERMNSTGRVGTSPGSRRVRNARVDKVDKAEAERLYRSQRGQL